MANSGTDAISNAFDDDLILGKLWQGIRKSAGAETTGEKQAREAREKALQQVRNADELAKQTRIENNATALGTKQGIEGEASDAEILQVLQMLRNGMTPEQITAATGIGGGNGGGAQAYTPHGDSRALAQAPVTGTAAQQLQQRLTASGGAFRTGGLPVNRRLSGGTKLAQPYQDANGSWVYPSNGPRRDIDGGNPINTGVASDPRLGQAGQDPRLRFQISDDGSSYSNVGYDTDPRNSAPNGQGGSSGSAGGPSLSDFSPEEMQAAMALANKGKWSQQGEYDKAGATERDALDYLRSQLEGIKNPTIQDGPEALKNAAVISQQARDAQKFGMDKLKGLTDVKETAEERLMREVARRNQENQMASQRKATLGNLAARGVYGSGAELASMLGAQSTTAQERTLSEMEANANAQKRALAALGQYTDAGFKLGDQDLKAGTAQNNVNNFNTQMKEQHNQWATQMGRDLNNDSAKRVATSADAQRDYARTIERQTNNRVNTKLGEAGLQIGTNTNGTQLANAESSHLADAYKDQEANAKANDPGRGGYLGLF